MIRHGTGCFIYFNNIASIVMTETNFTSICLIFKAILFSDGNKAKLRKFQGFLLLPIRTNGVHVYAKQ